MRTLLSLFVVLISLYSITSKADLQTECSHYHEFSSVLQFVRQFDDPAWCILSIDPVEIGDYVYRSYLVGNDGLFMVFNAYGEGSDSLFTAARDFYFFPRTALPDGKMTGNTLSVQTASKDAVFNFNGDTGKILNMENGEVTEDLAVNSANNGGVEIKSFKGLFLDAGFAVGHDPAMDRNRKVSFQDENGVQCTMTAAEVFTYANQGVSFAFPTDGPLKTFLAAKCPQLKISF